MGTQNEDLQVDVRKDETGEKPTEEDVKTAMRGSYERPGTGGDNASIEFHSLAQAMSATYI